MMTRDSEGEPLLERWTHFGARFHEAHPGELAALLHELGAYGVLLAASHGTDLDLAAVRRNLSLRLRQKVTSKPEPWRARLSRLSSQNELVLRLYLGIGAPEPAGPEVLAAVFHLPVQEIETLVEAALAELAALEGPSP